MSSRGAYLFPVAAEVSAPVLDGRGGDPATRHVSAYELYTAPFRLVRGQGLCFARPASVRRRRVSSGAAGTISASRRRTTQSRSSYFGVIDLAGFKKDRFYLYQAHWRPDLPMAHVLPHWTLARARRTGHPGARLHVRRRRRSSSSMGDRWAAKRKGTHEYRLRWDDVVYEPGTLKVVTYKNGAEWASDAVRTAGAGGGAGGARRSGGRFQPTALICRSSPCASSIETDCWRLAPRTGFASRSRPRRDRRHRQRRPDQLRAVPVAPTARRSTASRSSSFAPARVRRAASPSR